LTDRRSRLPQCCYPARRPAVPRLNAGHRLAVGPPLPAVAALPLLEDGVGLRLHGEGGPHHAVGLRHAGGAGPEGRAGPGLPDAGALPRRDPGPRLDDVATPPRHPAAPAPDKDAALEPSTVVLPAFSWSSKQPEYYVSKKSLPILYTVLLFRLGQDFLDIQYGVLIVLL